jgi:hypothetical protein
VVVNVCNQNKTNAENNTPNTALSFCVYLGFSFLSQEGLEEPQVNKENIKNIIKNFFMFKIYFQ